MLDQEFRQANWQKGESCELDPEAAVSDPPEKIGFIRLPGTFSALHSLSEPRKALQEFLYRNNELQLLRVPKLKLESEPGESREAFTLRLQQALRSERERELEKLEVQFEKKQQQLEAKLQRAEAKIEKEKGDVSAKTFDTAISFGMAALGAFLGRKTVSVSTASRASRGVRGAGRVMKEKADVQRAEDALMLVEQDMEELALTLQEATAELGERFQLEHYPIEEFSIKPRRSDIFDVQVVLAWEPQLHFGNFAWGAEK
jgi:hypothetical protein